MCGKKQKSNMVYVHIIFYSMYILCYYRLMLVGIAERLDQWVVRQNLEAGREGFVRLSACRIRLLGQMALLELRAPLALAATNDVDVYALTDTIIKQIEPAKEKILEVCKSHNLSPRIGVNLVLSVDKSEASPEVGFGARTIRFLADIGAFIDVDYQLSQRIQA